jgi:hypothetical protein
VIGGTSEREYTSGLHLALVPLPGSIQRVVSARDLPILLYGPVMGSGGRIVRSSGLIDAVEHLSGNAMSPPDCIIGIMNSDTIGSKVSRDVGHSDLVGEFTDPGHWAVVSWGCHRPVEKSSIPPWHQENSV